MNVNLLVKTIFSITIPPFVNVAYAFQPGPTSTVFSHTHESQVEPASGHGGRIDFQNYNPDEPGWRQQDLSHDIGYMVDASHLSKDFWVDPQAHKIFEAYRAKLGANILPTPMPEEFEPVVRKVRDMIEVLNVGNDDEDRRQAQTIDLYARKITRAAFCFGTDSTFETLKIARESRFVRVGETKNGTGLMQMTQSGINEVNDQLGFIRKGKSALAPDENEDVLKRMLACFNTAKFRDGIKKITKELIVKDIDYDLVAGQILLKVYLAVEYSSARRGQKDRIDSRLYSQALRRYNNNPAYVRAYVKFMMEHWKKWHLVTSATPELKTEELQSFYNEWPETSNGPEDLGIPDLQRQGDESGRQENDDLGSMASGSVGI